MAAHRSSVSSSGASPRADAELAEKIERWERERALGRSAFVWRRGVIGWGLPAALLTVAYKLLQQHEFAWPLVLSQQVRLAAGLSLLVFPLCGYLFGHWLWKAGERNYDRLLREAHDEHVESPAPD